MALNLSALIGLAFLCQFQCDIPWGGGRHPFSILAQKSRKIVTFPSPLYTKRNRSASVKQ